MMKGRDRWLPATVLSKSAPTSYVIKMPQGQLYRRNRQHFRMASNTKDETYDNFIDDNIVNESHKVETDTNQQDTLPLPQNPRWGDLLTE